MQSEQKISIYADTELVNLLKGEVIEQKKVEEHNPQEGIPEDQGGAAVDDEKSKAGAQENNEKKEAKKKPLDKSLDIEKIKSSFNKLLYGYEKQSSDTYSVENAPIIIANAATLWRFQVEVIELLSTAQDIKEEDKNKILQELFGENSEYHKLYDAYYKTDGLVQRAQERIGVNTGIKPLFSGVLPGGFKDNDITWSNTGNIFNNISALKNELQIDQHAAQSQGKYALSTTHLNGEDLNGAMMGLVMSDPKQIGTLFALLGDKSNKGEITFEQDKSWHLGKKTFKGMAHSAARCLFVIAVLCVFAYSGAALAPWLISHIGIVSTTVETVASVVTAVTGFGLGLTAITYIDKKVMEERQYTAEQYQDGVMQANRAGTSSDNVLKYVLAPYYKGRREDLCGVKSDIEKKLNNISSTVFDNKRAINACYDHTIKGNIQKIVNKMMEPNQLFGLHIGNKMQI